MFHWNCPAIQKSQNPLQILRTRDVAVVLIATFATSATKVPLGAVLDSPGIGFGDFFIGLI